MIRPLAALLLLTSTAFAQTSGGIAQSGHFQHLVYGSSAAQNASTLTCAKAIQELSDSHKVIKFRPCVRQRPSR